MYILDNYCEGNMSTISPNMDTSTSRQDLDSTVDYSGTMDNLNVSLTSTNGSKNGSATTFDHFYFYKVNDRSYFPCWCTHIRIFRVTHVIIYNY